MSENKKGKWKGRIEQGGVRGKDLITESYTFIPFLNWIFPAGRRYNKDGKKQTGSRVKAAGLIEIAKCSVSYLDHNLLYVDNKTPDDHIYLQSAAKKFGVYVSRPGNGRRYYG